jgi:hypothetical protein
MESTSQGFGPPTPPPPPLAPGHVSVAAAGGESAWTLPKSAATIRPGQAALLGLAGFTLVEGIVTAVAGRDVQLAGGLALLIGGVVYALAMIGRLLGPVPEIRSLFAVVGTLLARWRVRHSQPLRAELRLIVRLGLLVGGFRRLVHLHTGADRHQRPALSQSSPGLHATDRVPLMA